MELGSLADRLKLAPSPARIGFTLLFLATLSDGHGPLAQSHPINKFCPVQVDRQPLPEYSINYEGHRIDFCCESCLKALTIGQKNTESHWTSSIPRNYRGIGLLKQLISRTCPRCQLAFVELAACADHSAGPAT